MKKIITIAAVCLIGAACFAGGPHRGRHHRTESRGSSGVELAAGIIRLVGESMRVVNVIQYGNAVAVQQPVVVVQRTPTVVVQRQPSVIVVREYRTPPPRYGHRFPSRHYRR